MMSEAALQASAQWSFLYLIKPMPWESFLEQVDDTKPLLVLLKAGDCMFSCL